MSWFWWSCGSFRRLETPCWLRSGRQRWCWWWRCWKIWYEYTSMICTIYTLVWRVPINKGKTMIKQWVGKNIGSSHLSSMLAMITMMTITTSATRAALDPSVPFLGSDNSAFLHLHIWVFDLLDFAHSCNCVSVGQGKCCRLVGTIKIGLMRHLQDDIYAQDVLRCYLHICVQRCRRYTGIYLLMRSWLKVISINVHRGCPILTKCKMSFMWSSRLQDALARTRCRLVATTMGANVQRVLLANLGSLLLANSAYSTDCVKGTAQGRKEVDHCILHAY